MGVGCQDDAAVSCLLFFVFLCDDDQWSIMMVEYMLGVWVSLLFIITLLPVENSFYL